MIAALQDGDRVDAERGIVKKLSQYSDMVSGPIIARIRKGLPVIIIDGPTRENEADLMCAAQVVSARSMAFMIRYTSGIICAPMTRERARLLRLIPLMQRPTVRFGTNFLMPVDVYQGTRSGVSAHDRMLTVRRLADSRAKPSDFGRPGHVFPLCAHPQLLRGRNGHTEAAITLLTMAKLQLVGVIGELMNENGTMMRGVSLKKFSRKFAIPILSIYGIKVSKK